MFTNPRWLAIFICFNIWLSVALSGIGAGGHILACVFLLVYSVALVIVTGEAKGATR